MTGFSSVTAVGNTTRKPELRYTPSGTGVCNFGLAINRRFKQNDELKEETVFVDITVFGKNAENVERYVEKGDPILVDGRLSMRQWEDSDGRRHTKHEIVAEQVLFLKRKEGGGHDE